MGYFNLKLTKGKRKNEIMPLNKTNELNNLLISLLVGLGGLFITLVGIIYNSIWKNIKDLWGAKISLETKVNKNSESISGIKATCEERKK